MKESEVWLVTEMFGPDVKQQVLLTLQFHKPSAVCFTDMIYSGGTRLYLWVTNTDLSGLQGSSRA